MDPTLLLTATITPPSDVKDLVRVDPVARMGDYIETLTFYLELPDDVLRRIVFVENSNSDMGKLRELAGRYPSKRVEFLGFFGLDYPGKYGRGYGEFKLLNYAFDHSEMIAGLGPEDHVWKGTGRLKLKNIAEMIQTAPKEYDLYCDLRNRPSRWMDMRYYSVTKGGYRRIFHDNLENTREDLIHPFAPDQEHWVVTEQLMRELVERKFGQARIVPRFRTQPIIEGISGRRDTNYANGFKNQIKNGLRTMTRKLVPSLWN